MSVKNRLRSQQLFNPDQIQTLLGQAINRDFVRFQHEYYADGRLRREAFSRQVQDFSKKYCPLSYNKDLVTQKTFQKFLEVNRHMALFNRKIDFDLPPLDYRVQTTSPWRLKVFARARALMHFVVSDFSEDEWFQECRNSSGSSVGVPFSNTSIERKLTFPVSVTEKAKPLFQRYLNFDSQLRLAVEAFNGLGPIMDHFNVVKGSRATTVDKTAEKRRFICVEPTANMYLQQGLMSMLYRRMKLVGLDVESLPDKHRQLAHDSSITGRNATIDWSSASDCVSIELLRYLLPPRWFDVVNRTRSAFTSINGEDVELAMFSTMGNAVTFPLETLVFWTFAHAVRLSSTPGNSLFPEWEDLGCVSVFGDDCIVPSPLAPDFIGIMEEVGFMVNVEKTFIGPEQFRESCGGDYLSGFDVRPFSLGSPQSARKSSLEPWLYIIANSLKQKYITYFGDLAYVYDRELWRCIFGLFAEHKILIKLVPSYYPDDAGLKMSEDIQRFAACYPMKLSRIAVDRNGSYSFNYLRFVYRTKNKKDDGIRLATWLKKPVTETVYSPTTPVRKIGGYVVAKGLSCHWWVPRVTSVAG